MARFLTVFVLLPFLFIGRAPELDARYAPQLRAALVYLQQCAPAEYQIVLQNTRAIRVYSEKTMFMGEVDPKYPGVIQFASYIFEHSDLYFPRGNVIQQTAKLIAHEARHEWQARQFPNLYSQYGYDKTAHDFLEQDAIQFAAPIEYCP